MNKHADKRRTRGAILVESAIVCAMLMLAMATGLFMHRIHHEKLVIVGDARAAAWTQALQGCNKSASLDSISRASDPSTPSITIDTESVPSFFGAVDHTRGAATGSITASDILGGRTYVFDENTTLACNEVPADKRGDVKSVIGYITSTLVPHFF